MTTEGRVLGGVKCQLVAAQPMELAMLPCLWHVAYGMATYLIIIPTLQMSTLELGLSGACLRPSAEFMAVTRFEPGISCFIAHSLSH